MSKPHKRHAGKKFYSVDRRTKKCLPDCHLAPITLASGIEGKMVVHDFHCSNGIKQHNQMVNTRQVRRQYEREMEKRK